jgi:hypothetical protein
MNSLHEVDTLIAAVRPFRAGMAEEAALYWSRAATVAPRRRAAAPEGAAARRTGC